MLVYESHSNKHREKQKIIPNIAPMYPLVRQLGREITEGKGYYRCIDYQGPPLSGWGPGKRCA